MGNRFICWIVAILFLGAVFSSFMVSVDRWFNPVPVMQQVNQPVNQPGIQPVIPPVKQPANQPVAAKTPVATPPGGVPVSKTPVKPTVSSREQYFEATKLLAEAKLASQNALDEIETWECEILPLLEQPEGQDIAANQDLVEKLAFVMEQKRLSADELKVIQRQLGLLSRRIDTLATSKDEKLLSALEMSQIRQLHFDSVKAQNAWKRAVKRAFAIERQSKREVAVAPTSPVVQPELQPTPKKETQIPTVAGEASTNTPDGEIALQAKKNAATPKETETLNPTVKSNLKSMITEIKDLQTISELENEQLGGSTAEQNAPAEYGLNPAVEAKVEPVVVPIVEPVVTFEPELVSAALSPNVKSTLAPFLAKRDCQPRKSGGSVRFESTLDAAPMSLSRLTSIGALDESLDGLKKLIKIAGNRKLPEPKWHMHTMPNNWSAEDKAFLQCAQKMLRDYGDILVYRGLLSQ